jgi:integrase
MPGHVEKRRKSSWTIIIDNGRDKNGKRLRVTKNYKGTKKDAEREMARMLVELEQGSYVKPTDMNVATLLDKFVVSCIDKSQDLAPQTKKRDKGIIENYLKPQLGYHKLKDLAPLHVQDYVNWATSAGEGCPAQSGASVAKHYNVLRKALRQAVDWKLIKDNPADHVHAPGIEDREANVLKSGKEVFDLIMAFSGTPLFIPVLLAAAVDLRRAEILGLLWECVDLETGRAQIKNSLQRVDGELRLLPRVKTKHSKRQVALPATVVKELRALKERQEADKKANEDYDSRGFVCCWADGRPVSPEYFSHGFTNKKRDLGVHIKLHELRHTFSTLMLLANMHPKKVAAQGGHDVRVLLTTYSHIIPEMQDEVAVAAEEIIFTNHSRQENKSDNQTDKKE